MLARARDYLQSRRKGKSNLDTVIELGILPEEEKEYSLCFDHLVASEIPDEIRDIREKTGKTLPEAINSVLSRKRQYSKGEINRLIDSLLHPLFDQSSALMAVDTALHGLVEQNPPETIKKFARYTLPKIIEEILKSQ